MGDNGTMQQELLPLFPLAAVLLPRTRFPLHIFEDRYKELIGDAIRDNSEFGVVLSREEGIARYGCAVVVDEVTHRYPDGRMDIIVAGLRRFEILDLNQEKPCLRGTVSYFNDEETEPVAADVKQRAIAGYRALSEFLGGGTPPEPDWRDPQLSFQLVQPVPDLAFRQQLLMTRSEAERMRLLAEFFPHHIERQRHISHVHAIAPTNGRGPHPVDS